MPKHKLVLASSSKIRRQIMEGAGLQFDVIPSPLDEEMEKQKLKHLQHKDWAMKLAAAKALALSEKQPNLIVLGADQTLLLNGNHYSKPKTLDDARRQLQDFRNKTHVLISAIVLSKGDEILWQHKDEARITMRNFTDTFLDEYMKNVSTDVLTSVGGYQIEGLGMQLFSGVEGDYFTIMGLPLLPLLAQLRAMSVITS